MSFEYVPTHVSTVDGSDAMMINADPFVLINEDGFSWTAERELWRSGHAGMFIVTIPNLPVWDDMDTTAADIQYALRNEWPDAMVSVVRKP